MPLDALPMELTVSYVDVPLDINELDRFVLFKQE